MKPSRALLLAALYTLSIVALTFLWEFVLADHVVALFIPKHAAESLDERLEFVFLSVGIALIALIAPGLLALRSLRKLYEAEGTQARLVSILQTTPDMVFVFDNQSRLIFANRSGRELFGDVPDDRLASVDIRRYIAPQDSDRVFHGAVPSAVRDGTWTGELGIIADKGAVVPYSVVIVAHKDDEGRLEYVSAVCRDVLQQKQFEQIKSDFVTIVSHELRTPLTAIHSALNLVSDEAGSGMSADAREMLHIAESNTDRLTRLVSDILDLEKIHYQRFDLKIAPLDAGALVNSSMAGLAPMARHAQIAMRFDAPVALQFEGDADRLSQVITNLLGNAIKFSHAGDEVRVTVTQPDEAHVRFAVRDHGPGIHWEHFPKLFGKFQQLGAPKNLVKQGTGLGLAISKAIVEQHGGEIGVESEYGKGSEFFFIVPRRQGSGARAG